MVIKKLYKQLAPFIFAGIAIVAFVFGIMLLAYLFLFGAIVGTILFLFNWVLNKIRTPVKLPAKKKSSQGRIIDSDDWKHL